MHENTRVLREEILRKIAMNVILKQTESDANYKSLVVHVNSMLKYKTIIDGCQQGVELSAEEFHLCFRQAV